jgi:F-type H+-transporting ATPase subunit c
MTEELSPLHGDFDMINRFVAMQRRGIKELIMDLQVLIAVGAGIAVLTGAGAGIGIGIATSGFLQAISRQPEASGKMTPMFFVGVALAESTAIYGLVISILLITRLG